MQTVRDFLTCHFMMKEDIVLYSIEEEEHAMCTEEFLLIYEDEACSDTGNFGENGSIVYEVDQQESDARSGALSFMVLTMAIAAAIASVMLVLAR